MKARWRRLLRRARRFLGVDAPPTEQAERARQAKQQASTPPERDEDTPRERPKRRIL